MNRYTFQTDDDYQAKCYMHSAELAATIDEIRRIVRQQLKHELQDPTSVLEQVMSEIDEVIFKVQE